MFRGKGQERQAQPEITWRALKAAATTDLEALLDATAGQAPTPTPTPPQGAKRGPERAAPTPDAAREGAGTKAPKLDADGAGLTLSPDQARESPMSKYPEPLKPALLLFMLALTEIYHICF